MQGTRTDGTHVDEHGRTFHLWANGWSLGDGTAPDGYAPLNGAGIPISFPTLADAIAWYARPAEVERERRAMPRTDHQQMGDVATRIDRHLAAELRDAAMLVEVENTACAGAALARIATLHARYLAACAAFCARVDHDYGY